MPLHIISRLRYVHLSSCSCYYEAQLTLLFLQYYSSPPDEDEEIMMSAALVPRSATAASSAVACRVPERRVATLTGSEELPPGLPVQVTFVAAHHCAGCGQPRSHAYHKDHPLIPGQVAPASLCRKCEKKIDQGRAIDSIVVPIRDLEAEKEAKYRGRCPRSTSRTRVVIREWSGDRDSPPREHIPRESPSPPKRSISYRHVSSRSLSRSARQLEPAQKEEPAPAPDSRRHYSPPPRRSKHVIEHQRYDELHSDVESKAKQAAKSSPPRSGCDRRSNSNDDYYEYVGVDVRRRHSRDVEPAKTKRYSKQESAPLLKKTTSDDTPPPPMGLSAVQSKRTYYHRVVDEQQQESEDRTPGAPRPSTFDKFLQGIFRGKTIF
jgi:hypothetical protein